MALTRKQRSLRREIEEIASTVDMDYWNIEAHYAKPLRTIFLELMKSKLVRGEVVLKYTVLDELLADIICNYYFGAPKSGTYRDLWKTRRFQVFVHYIMDETFLLKKLATVHAIKPVPKDVHGAITRINDVRNAVAHSLFPENRRRYRDDKKVMYQGAPLFTLKGIEKFEEDFDLAHRYLQKRVGM